MAKNNRGLPPSFSLDIPEPTPPVQLGDYLEEIDAAPVVRHVPKPQTVSNIVEMPRPVVEREPVEKPAVPTAEQVHRAETPNRAVDQQKRLLPAETRPMPRPKRGRPKTPIRKQINASPESQRMIEDIIDHVQTYSVQKDASASEIFHALVLALYEAKDHLDLSDVPARGRWGTPTAQAFPVALKGKFQDAIAQYKRSRR